MKCPCCWAEKAYVRKANGWKDALLYCLLLRSMRCHHCYHKFVVSWFAMLGKQTKMRPIRADASERPVGLSHAARCREAELDSVELAGVASESRGCKLS